MKPEELYVIEHPSFKAILDQIEDLVERTGSDEIDHAREYVAVLQKAGMRSARRWTSASCGSRAARGDADWRQDFDVKTVPALTPRLPWLEEIDAIWRSGRG